MCLCADCFHSGVCQQSNDTVTNCIYFVDKRTIVELPCCFGDRGFHITKYNTIVEEYVSGIHYGRLCRKYSYGKIEKYIIMRSVNTGYVSNKISFEEYIRDVFPTLEAAKAEVERRKQNCYAKQVNIQEAK